MRAFTLVELLVVIAIIALLVSILLPALAKAKEQAKNVKCKVNLKQQMLAYSMYVDDFDNMFPTDYTILDALGNPYPSGTSPFKVGAGRESARGRLSRFGGPSLLN